MLETEPPVPEGEAEYCASYEFAFGLPFFPCSSGPFVEYIQSRLGDLGFSVDIDGLYGVRTTAAVADYQSMHGLSAGGIVGIETWTLMFRGVGLLITPDEVIFD